MSVRSHQTIYKSSIYKNTIVKKPVLLATCFDTVASHAADTAQFLGLVAAAIPARCTAHMRGAVQYRMLEPVRYDDAEVKSRYAIVVRTYVLSIRRFGCTCGDGRELILAWKSALQSSRRDFKMFPGCHVKERRCKLPVICARSKSASTKNGPKSKRLARR